MKDDFLSLLGLAPHQSTAYRYLLDSGPTPPPGIAKAIKLTRSNAYKVLDQLVDLGLVSRLDINKKLHYKAEDPIALASIVAEERNRVIALEKTTKEALKELRKTYSQRHTSGEVETYQGSEAVKALYEHQAKLKQPIYFVKTRSDIPFMGYETMARIRRLTVPHGIQRYGIVPDAPEAAIDHKIDPTTNLNRTWIIDEDYTAPVEWTTSGDELNILIFDGGVSAIRIKNKIVAGAFRQLWSALDKNLRANPDYKKLPRKAKRQI